MTISSGESLGPRDGRHAVMVGVAVSVMHTTSVVALGVITLWASSLFPPETVFPWLSLVSGTVVLGLGLWLLVTRLRARHQGGTGHSHAGHSHAGHSHVHDHSGHPHAHEPHEHGHDHGRAPEGAVGVLERVEAEHGHSHAPPRTPRRSRQEASRRSPYRGDSCRRPLPS